MWSAIAAGGLAVIGFFAWLIRKLWSLETQLNKDYMTREETARFFGELVAPLHTSLGEIKEENRDMRRTVTEGFREMNKRLDNKQDRRNGTG